MITKDFRPTLEDEGLMAKSRISAAKKPRKGRPTGGVYGKQNKKKLIKLNFRGGEIPLYILK